jgi:predicted type IV restriction endonuclease
MDFILLRKKSNTDDKDRIKRNWEYLKEQNIKKANYICYKKNEVPTKKSDIETIKIFNSQLNNYINNHNSIAILNAFPIFLYDYLK